MRKSETRCSTMHLPLRRERRPLCAGNRRLEPPWDHAKRLYYSSDAASEPLLRAAILNSWLLLLFSALVRCEPNDGSPGDATMGRTTNFVRSNPAFRQICRHGCLPRERTTARAVSFYAPKTTLPSRPRRLLNESRTKIAQVERLSFLTVREFKYVDIETRSRATSPRCQRRSSMFGLQLRISSRRRKL